MTSVCEKQTPICMNDWDVILAFLFVQNAKKRLEYITERWKPNEKKSQCEIQKSDDTPHCAQAADHEKGGKKTGKVSCSCGPCVHSYASVQKSRCVNATDKL